MAITINADLTATIVNDLGMCNLPGYNPETLNPWRNDAELTAYAESVQGNPRFFSKPVEKVWRTVLTPVEFKMQFSAPERIAIKTAAIAGDALLEDFLDILNDPRLKEVTLTLQDNIAAIGYLVSLGILTQERSEAILKGI